MIGSASVDSIVVNPTWLQPHTWPYSITRTQLATLQRNFPSFDSKFSSWPYKRNQSSSLLPPRAMSIYASTSTGRCKKRSCVVLCWPSTLKPLLRYPLNHAKRLVMLRDENNQRQYIMTRASAWSHKFDRSMRTSLLRTYPQEVDDHYTDRLCKILGDIN